MEKRIITISREFGSGGRFIGEEVAKKLGISYYDKDIIGQIAEQSGFAPEYIRENAELSPKKGLFAYAFSGRDITGKSVEDMVYEAQRNVILKIAEKESCVIVGRCADAILKDDPRCVSVFLSAPLKERIQTVMKRDNLDEKGAKHKIEQTDRRRADNYRYYTRRIWGMSGNYQMCIDTSLGEEYVLETVTELLRKHIEKEAV